jgi:hypothetical protein
VQLPVATAQLIAALARPETYDRTSIASTAANEVRALLALTGMDPLVWNRETAQIALWRAFLATLPAVVFEYPDRPCRAVVAARLAHLLGEEAHPETISQLMTVVKRLQRYLLSGRRALSASSFDITSAFHHGLLQRQGRRCAVCGYLFEANDLEEDPSAFKTATLQMPVPGGDDRSPTKLHRRAVLDHVLPVYLAGDDRGNWQILCRTCNDGKSDLVMPLGGPEWIGSARAWSLIRTRPRLFYMVLARDGACTKCGRGPKQTELRLARRDPVGSDAYPNLIAMCRSLLTNGRC